MLDMNPDIVREIAAHAREFQAKEAVVIPHEPNDASDDWAMQVLADHVDDPTYAQACAIIDSLDPDQQVRLVALMWVGRGDLDWSEAVREARDRATGRTAEYLLSTPLVSDYLEEGLEQLGYSASDG